MCRSKTVTEQSTASSKSYQKPSSPKSRFPILTEPIVDSYSTLTIVDISGIHDVRVRQCGCYPKLSFYNQLLQSDMLPATIKRPQTAFTFRLLEDLDISNLEGKFSLRSYYNKLQRLTSNAFFDKVPDRYRELTRALRQWRDLQSRLRAGEPFMPEQVSIPLGGLALFCPACPQPGINLPINWEEDPSQ